MITAFELQKAYDDYLGGSDGRTRHPFNPNFIFTDGAKRVADQAQAHWLLDILATEVEPGVTRRWINFAENLFFVQVAVKADRSALITASQDIGEGGVPINVFWRKQLDYTSLPEGNWVLYLGIDQVLERGFDRVVCFLPTEY